MPPVRAWLIWQATPGTFGSSKPLTHTLSFGPRNRNVVLRQPTSSADAGRISAADSSASINPSLLPIPPLPRRLPSGAAPAGSIIEERIAEVLGADLAQFQDDPDRLPCLRLRQRNRDLDPLQPLAVIWRHHA